MELEWQSPVAPKECHRSWLPQRPQPKHLPCTLVDAADKPLWGWVPQEPDRSGVHGFHLHVLRGCGRHCSQEVMGGKHRQETQWEGREKGKPELPVGIHRQTKVPRTWKSQGSLEALSGLAKKELATSHLLMKNSL